MMTMTGIHGVHNIITTTGRHSVHNIMTMTDRQSKDHRTLTEGEGRGVHHDGHVQELHESYNGSL